MITRKLWNEQEHSQKSNRNNNYFLGSPKQVFKEQKSELEFQAVRLLLTQTGVAKDRGSHQDPPTG